MTSMVIKRNQLSCLVVLAALLLVACSEKTPEDTIIGTAAYQLNLETNSVTLGARQNLSSSFKIVTLNTGWEVVDSERLPWWLSISPISGKESTVVTITAQENTSKDTSRSATISFRSTDTKQPIEKAIMVKQDALGGYIVTDQSVYELLPQPKDALHINVSSNLEWEVFNDNSWLDVSVEDSSKVMIYADWNFLSESRSGNITFKQKRGDVSTTITIIQAEPRIEFSESPVSFGFEGGSKTVKVKSNIAWEMTDYVDDWLEYADPIFITDEDGMVWNEGSTFHGEVGETDVTFTAGRSYLKKTSYLKIPVFTYWSQRSVFSNIEFYQDASPSYDKEISVTGNGKTVSFHMIFVKSGETLKWEDDEYDADYVINLPLAEKDNYIDKHRRYITLTKDYYLGETEVTQALWTAVMGPSNKWSQQYGLGDNYPAYNVGLDEIDTFLKRLSNMTGIQFELPTEVEWEYAASDMPVETRTTAHSWYAGGLNGNEISLMDVGWYQRNSEGMCHPVKQKNPNGLGIFDMSGNLREYCSDYFAPIEAGTVINPIGKGSYRNIRGGSYEDDSDGCTTIRRSHAENPDSSEKGNRLTGFRLKAVFK